MQLAKILFSEYDVFGRVLLAYGAEYTRLGGKVEMAFQLWSDLLAGRPGNE
jgi:hypothetical protein